MEGENEILVPVSVVEETLEAVHEQQENAQEIAEQIAEAALEGARGERIEKAERRIEECHSILASLPTSLAEQTSHQIASAIQGVELSIMERISQLSADVAVLRNPPTLEIPPASIPPILEAIVEPETVEAPPAEIAREPEPAKKKKHRFL